MSEVNIKNMHNDSIQFPEKGFYYHYKHDPVGDINNYAYEVVGIGRNTEEKTFTVLYYPLYKNDWMSPADYQSRPLSMFLENVEKDGKVIPRFWRIVDTEVLAKLEEIKKSL